MPCKKCGAMGGCYCSGGMASYSDGGKVNHDDDSMLMDQVGHELMTAIHAKDKSQFLESLRAIVLNLKDENDMPSFVEDDNHSIG